MIYLDSLLRSAQNSRKCSFLDNLKTIIQEGNLEARQMTPFFFIYFFRCLNIHFWIWKYSKFIFTPLVHSGLQNISIFGQKLPIWTAHHNFLESRNPEVSNNLYYVLSTSRGQIPISLCSSSWTIYYSFCINK